MSGAEVGPTPRYGQSVRWEPLIPAFAPLDFVPRRRRVKIMRNVALAFPRRKSCTQAIRLRNSDQVTCSASPTRALNAETQGAALAHETVVSVERDDLHRSVAQQRGTITRFHTMIGSGR